MAIDTAAKRRNVAALLPLFAPGVTPDATPGVEWRQQAGWGYSGIAVGGVAPEPTPELVADAGAGGFGARWAGTDFRERDRIASDIRSLYETVYSVASQIPDSEIADEAAAVVADYAPVSAPDLPPSSVVDWEALVEDGRQAITSARIALTALRRRVREMAETRAAFRDGEDAAFMLLMGE